jgi:hypothetical protein
VTKCVTSLCVTSSATGYDQQLSGVVGRVGASVTRAAATCVSKLSKKIQHWVVLQHGGMRSPQDS